MATIIERDSSGGPAGLLITVVILFLLAGGAWFAYTNGVFGGHSTTIENNKTVIMPAEPSTPAAPKP
jgi:hypothetical protein